MRLLVGFFSIVVAGLCAFAGLPDALVAQSAPPSAAPSRPQSAWVRLCEVPATRSPDSFGKEREIGQQTCLTYHERMDGNTAMVIIAVGVRSIQGQHSQQFTFTVPAGMQLQPGTRATFFPQDLWDKAQKNVKIEKDDEARLRTMNFPYARCQSNGCTVETEATPELVGNLKGHGGLVVFAINSTGQPIAFPIPLNGFAQAHDGAPVNNELYYKARSDLIQKILARKKNADGANR
jgi:invasion protein IalB